MNNKFSPQDFAGFFAQYQGISKKKAEVFLRSFFETIEFGLIEDKFVKIKGFGTFKIIIVGERESINVNTGERIQISSHSKITFTPDSLLKNAVNKPFAQFQTVALYDETEENEFAEIDTKVALEVEEIDKKIETTLAEKKTKELSPTVYITQESTEEKDIQLTDGSNTSNIESSSNLTSSTNATTTTESIQNQRDQIIISDIATKTIKKDGILKVEPPHTENQMPTTPNTVSSPTSNKTDTQEISAPITNHSTIEHVEKEYIKQERELSQEIERSEEKELSVSLSHKKSLHRVKITGIVLCCLVFLVGSYTAGYFHVFGDHINTTKTSLRQDIQIKQQTQQVMNIPEMTDSQKKLFSQQKTDSVQKPSQDVATPTQIRPENKYKQMKGGNYRIIGTLGTHKLQSGENLYRLAKKTYGNRDFAKYIIFFNKLDNPNIITIGSEIELPKLEQKD